MSLYVSPNSSFEGGTPIAAAVPVAAAVAAPVPAAAPVPLVGNARPQLNERLLNLTQRYPSRIPAGTFTDYHRAPVMSRRFFADPPFFPNAKPASMLERGLRRSDDSRLYAGDQGLLIEDDGPSTEVKVIRNPPDASGNLNYTFLIIKPNPRQGEEIRAPANGRFHEWDFYSYTRPVPFVPRAGSLARASAALSAEPGGGGGGGGGSGGGSGGKRNIKKTRKNKKSKKTRRRSKSN
jgi:uncharacterized membrane protein YgcG